MIFYCHIVSLSFLQKYSWIVLVIFFVNGKIMIKVTNNQYKNGNRNENIKLFIIV